MKLLITLVALATFMGLTFTQEAEDIRVPPSIVKQNEKKHEYYVIEGEKTLDCEATGSPKPTYKWLKDGAELNLNAPNINSNTQTGTIQIDPLRSTDEGYYQCMAENLNGKALSNVVYLQKSLLDSFDNLDAVHTLSANEGEAFKILCGAPRSIPDATITWSTVQNKDDKYPEPVIPNSRIHVDSLGDLHFTNLIPEDSHGGYFYKCQAYNAFKSETKHGSLSSLTVISKPNAPNVRPFILFSTQAPDNIALIGSPITLMCIFQAKPSATITWSRKGGSLPVGRHSYDNDADKMEMTITDVREEDEGVYTCSGSNGAGTVPHDISLSVQSVPANTDYPNQVKNQNLTVGDNMHMECAVKAIPDASVSWFVNGDPINLATLGPRYSLTSGDTVLNINNVCKVCTTGNSDLNVFSCNASNVHGYSYQSGYLNVLLPTLITASPASVELEYGQEVVFNCEGSSDDSTPVTIDWLRNGELIIYQPGLMEKNPDNSLVITTYNEDDGGASFAGEYTCEVTNGYTTKTSDPANLTLPPEPYVAFDLTTIWYVFLIIAIIVLVLLILLIFCLCRHYMRGNTYPVDEKERDMGHDPLKELADTGYNEYQRPEDEPIKGSQGSINRALNPKMEDESSLAEYGTDIDTGKFNEDGSFIGQYQVGQTKKAPRNYYNSPDDSIV